MEFVFFKIHNSNYFIFILISDQNSVLN
jgi:hypothetical protein